MELAKLRREQRRLKQEDNFDTAAILLGLAKQERAAKEARQVTSVKEMFHNQLKFTLCVVNPI